MAVTYQMFPSEKERNTVDELNLITPWSYLCFRSFLPQEKISKPREDQAKENDSRGQQYAAIVTAIVIRDENEEQHNKEQKQTGIQNYLEQKEFHWLPVLFLIT